jgi:hypothetical protein
MRYFRTSFIVVLGAALVAAGPARADLDICDRLGLSGLTISSDSDCLQISGEVRYEFQWGDYRGPADRDTGATAFEGDDDDEDEGGLDLCDALGLSGLTISSDDNCLTLINHIYFFDPRPMVTFTPYFSYTSPVNYPFLSTENPPGTVVNPALNIPLATNGIGLSAGFSTGLDLGGIEAGIDHSRYFGTGQIQNHPLPFGFGVTTNGINAGVFAAFDTIVRDATTQVSGTHTGLHLLWETPLNYAGDGITAALSGGIGPSFLYETQRQETTINTETPIFGAGAASVINYDTDVTTYAVGLDGQIEMSGFFPLGGADQHFFGDSYDASGPVGPVVRPGDLMMPYYQITGGINPMAIFSSVNDNVDAQGLGGALNYQSANTFDAQNLFIGGNVGAELGIVKGNMRISLSGSLQLVPRIIVDRVNSDAGGTPLLPVVRAVPAWEAGLQFGLNFRY